MLAAVAPLLFAAGAACQSGVDGQGRTTGGWVLHAADYKHYVDLFRQQEMEATGKVYDGESGEDSWTWMEREVPWFDSSDKKFEEMYYFRWYAWKKHLVATPTGYVITEWLPKPELTDGSFGALPDAAPFHIAEARWLREAKIAEDDARFWFARGLDSHKYSDAMPWTVRNLTLANGDVALGTELLPAMKRRTTRRGRRRSRIRMGCSGRWMYGTRWRSRSVGMDTGLR